jgi:hypothetical protein
VRLMGYNKNCVVHGWKVLCIGELITPNGPVTWIGIMSETTPIVVWSSLRVVWSMYKDGRFYT